MRRIALLLICAILLTAGGALWWRARSTSPPQRALTSVLSALQNGNLSRAEKLTAGGLGLDYSNSRAEKLYRAMWSTMSFVVVDCREEEDRAVVTVAVTMVDMETLLTESSQELLGRNLTGRRTDERRFYKQLTDNIDSGKIVSITETASATLIHTEDGWRLDMEASPALLVAITGGVGPLTP